MYRSTLVTKLKGQTIPERLLDQILKGGTSCFGMAALSKDGIAVFHEKEPVELAKVLEAQKLFKREEAIFWFGHFDGEFSSDFIQPFAILEKNEEGKKKPLLLAFACGGFLGFQKPKTTTPPEYYLMIEALKPYIHKQHNLQPNAGLEAELNSSVTSIFMKNMCAPMGSILLLSEAGLKIYSCGQMGKAFDWGWVSHPGDYDEQSYPETTEKEKESTAGPKSLSDFLSTQKDSEPPFDVSNKDEAHKDDDDVQDISSLSNDKEKKQQTLEVPKKIIVKLLSGSSYERVPIGTKNVRPPSHLKNIKDINAWYIDHAGGIIPKKANTKPALETVLPRDLKRMGASRLFESAALIEIVKEEVKQPHPKTVIKNKNEVKEALPQKVIPLIPIAERDYVLDQLITQGHVTNLDRQSIDIVDPSDYKDGEKKLPSFTEQTSIPLEDIPKWGYEALLSLAVEYPTSAAVLMLQLTGILEDYLENMVVVEDDDNDEISLTNLVGKTG